MANLRVVYDNAADRASLTTTAVVSGLTGANLLNDVKSKVCRSIGTSITITLTWTNAETISVVAACFTNLSTSATMTVNGYTNTGDTTAVYSSSGSCAQGSMVANKGVNNFAYGGSAYGRMWLSSSIAVKKLEVIISDSTNPSGYIEIGRLVVGNHWAPTVGADVSGTTMTLVDTSQQFRTDGGDMYLTAKARYRKQVLSLPSLNTVDRAKMWNILWNNGAVKPLFISLYPNNSDSALEQAHMLYGRLTANPAMSTPYYNVMAATVDIEEI